MIAGDADALTIVPGVGKKVAQRVILDLRDSLGGEGELMVEGPLAEMREALVTLGLTPSEAERGPHRRRGRRARGRGLLREALQKVGR